MSLYINNNNVNPLVNGLQNSVDTSVEDLSPMSALKGISDALELLLTSLKDAVCPVFCFALLNTLTLGSQLGFESEFQWNCWGCCWRNGRRKSLNRRAALFYEHWKLQFKAIDMQIPIWMQLRQYGYSSIVSQNSATTLVIPTVIFNEECILTRWKWYSQETVSFWAFGSF